MMILALGLVVVGTMGFCVVATGGGKGMELRKRMGGSKNNDSSSEGEDDSDPSESVDASTSSDDEDETEVAKRSSSKRKKSKNGKSASRKKKTIFQCRFCKTNFTESQALGGHMNCHRHEKDKEALQNAKNLVAKRTQYAANLPWNMPGYTNYGGSSLMPNPQVGPHGMGALLYNVPNQAASGSLQNSLIVNQDSLNAHGQHFPTHVGGGGGHYNPAISGRTHYNSMPPKRESMMSSSTDNVQTHNNPMPSQRDHSMLQDRRQHQGQPSGTFHNSNIQGSETTLLDIMMNMQNIRSSPSERSTSRQSPQSHFVDERGNLSRDFGSGPSSHVMPEDDLPLMIERSECQDESSAFTEPGQASFETDAPVDASETSL